MLAGKELERHGQTLANTKDERTAVLHVHARLEEFTLAVLGLQISPISLSVCYHDEFTVRVQHFANQNDGLAPGSFKHDQGVFGSARCFDIFPAQLG